LMDRLTTYKNFEQRTLDDYQKTHKCKLQR